MRNQSIMRAASSKFGLGMLSVLGGAAGAALLLSTSNTAFGRIVPWLLLAATLLFLQSKSHRKET
ncbi:hypothetical protein [Cupriavidus necator]